MLHSFPMFDLDRITIDQSISKIHISEITNRDDKKYPRPCCIDYYKKKLIYAGLICIEQKRINNQVKN